MIPIAVSLVYCGHDLRHCRLRWAALAPHPLDRPCAILRRPVLAHLPFPFEPDDRQLEADDTLELRADEFRRRVGHRPWLRPARLMRLGQAGYDVQQSVRILE